MAKVAVEVGGDFVVGTDDVALCECYGQMELVLHEVHQVLAGRGNCPNRVMFFVSNVLDGAIIGARCLIAAGAIVLPETKIPEGMLAVGAPAVVKRSIIGSASEEWVTGNPGRYKQMAHDHMVGLREITREEAATGHP